MTALVLAGHGSHITPQTAGPVWRLVDALREQGVADEVTAAFWKEQPSFSTVFNSVTSKDITVVPLFTAQGYFTQTVIPAEMRLEGAITRCEGRVIRYARTLSEHPYLSEVMASRVEDGLRQLDSSPAETAVAVIGHSTRRNPESRRAAEIQAAKIRALHPVMQVEAVFLDDSPEIIEIYSITSAKNLIAIPYFLAAGSHTTIDVPRELGLTSFDGPQQVNGRTVLYMPPVGTGEMLQEVVLELARDAGAMLYAQKTASPWDGFPSAGVEALGEAVANEGVIHFGELRLTSSEVCVWGDESTSKMIGNPAELRTFIRENPFRSLTTGKQLPIGWCFPVQNPKMLGAVVETIYPGAIANWAAHRQGKFAPNSFDATIARQTGNYRALADMSRADQSQIVNRVCGNCVRHPTWFHGQSPADVIPCPEPCNHWLSAALEVHQTSQPAQELQA